MVLISTQSNSLPQRGNVYLKVLTDWVGTVFSVMGTNFPMIPPHSGPGEFRSSQWSVCQAARKKSGLNIYGLYMYKKYFYICSVHRHLHSAL